MPEQATTAKLILDKQQLRYPLRDGLRRRAAAKEWIWPRKNQVAALYSAAQQQMANIMVRFLLQLSLSLYLNGDLSP